MEILLDSPRDPKRALAEAIYKWLSADPDIPHAANEDGCTLRNEIMIGKLMTDKMAERLGVPTSNIRRALVVIPDSSNGEAIHAKNGLPKENLEALKKFALAHTSLTGVKHFNFSFRNQQFQIDRHGKILHTASEKVFTYSEDLNWSVGHIAPMVGDYVIDPALKKGVLTFPEWQKELKGSEKAIAMIADIGKLPEVAPQSLSDAMLQKFEMVLSEKKIAPYTERLPMERKAREQQLAETMKGLKPEQKGAVYDEFFKAQIKKGGLRPYAQWTDHFIGGHHYHAAVEKLPESKIDAEYFESRSWEKRLGTARKAIAPLKAYEEIVLKGPNAMVNDPSYQAITPKPPPRSR